MEVQGKTPMKTKIKVDIPKLFIFEATLPDGYTHTVDVYASSREEAVEKLLKDHGVKYPNFRLRKIISGNDSIEF